MDIGKAEIDRWHRQRGWLGIGYHYVIRRNGTTEKGREDDRPGAHTRGHNKHSIGVCLVGGVADDKVTAEANFTEAQMVALWGLLHALQAHHPNAAVWGHRNFTKSKECPSFDVVEWWAEAKDKPPVIRQMRTT